MTFPSTDSEQTLSPADHAQVPPPASFPSSVSDYIPPVASSQLPPTTTSSSHLPATASLPSTERAPFLPVSSGYIPSTASFPSTENSRFPPISNRDIPLTANIPSTASVSSSETHVSEHRAISLPPLAGSGSPSRHPNASYGQHASELAESTEVLATEIAPTEVPPVDVSLTEVPPAMISQPSIEVLCTELQLTQISSFEIPVPLAETSPTLPPLFQVNSPDESKSDIATTHPSLLASLIADEAISKGSFSTLILPADDIILDIFTTSVTELPLSLLHNNHTGRYITSSDHCAKKILAIRQTKHDVKAVVYICDESGRTVSSFQIYWDPISNSQIIFTSAPRLTIQRLQTASLIVTPSTPVHALNNKGTSINPGVWRITHNHKQVADMWVLRKPVPIRLPLTPEEEQREKEVAEWREQLHARQRGLDGDGNIDKNEQALIQSSKHRLTSQSDRGTVSSKRQCVSSMVGHLVSTVTEQKIDFSKQRLDIRGQNPLHNLEPGVCMEVDWKHTDGYTLERQGKLLHNTANSRVYAAKFSNQDIICKVINNAIQHEPGPRYNKRIRDSADAFDREFTLQRRLSHKHIVSLVDGDARFFALFLQPAMAHNLTDIYKWRYYNSHNFSGRPEDVVNIVYQGASALEYLHSKDIVHNDIKPGNLLYSRRNGLKICDFGISDTMSKNHGRIGGTCWYVPPEAKEGERGYAGDIWAFGITMLYLIGKMPLPEMLSSFPPWDIHGLLDDDKESLKRMNRWEKHVWDITGSLGPEKMHWCIKKMLEQNPKQRLTAKDLAMEWEIKST